MFKKWLICLFLIIYSFAFGYSEQVVVSQFDIGLKNSNLSSNYKYSLNGVTKSEDIKAVTSTDLSTVIDFNGAIGGSFTGAADDLKFNYSTAEKSVMIPLNRNNSTTVVTGAFQLTETTSVSGESALTYLIQDSIILPARSIALSQDTSVSTGVKFTYNDSAKAAHLSAYKMQKFMVRIAKSSVTDTNYDVIGKQNGMQLANNIDTSNSTSYAESFLDGNTEYVDFLVTADQYDKAQSISTNVGLSLKFMPEDIEVFGLPKGSYRIELYSFRYSKEVTTKGNVVITKEDNKTFSIGDTEFLEEGIDIISFSSAEFDTIKATILTIGNTTSSSITVSEDGSPMIGTITATSGSIYVDSTSSGALVVTAGGTLYNSQYYQLWSVVYTATNKTINTDTRTVKYTAGSKDISTTYNVISSTPQFTSEPLYQTVFAGFKDTTFSVGTFEIDDRTVNKYSDGYRNVKVSNVNLTSSAIDIAALYKGVNGTNMDKSSYNWLGNTPGNSLVISKVKSDSKGTFRNINDTAKNFTFYTTNWEPSLSFYESTDVNNDDDTVKVKWSSPGKSTYDATVSEDKVMFRMLKSGTVSEDYRYKPESNTNPILSSTSANLATFLGDTSNSKYFDLLFTAGEDSKITVGNTEFTFSKSNVLKIVGLDVGEYQLQIYSIQNEDTTAQSDAAYDYRVLTYGGVLGGINFGLPELEKDEYDSFENPYIIDSINVTTNSDGNKEVEVGVVIKADQQIQSLTKNNLVARKDEESTSSAFYYKNEDALLVEAWKPNYTTSSGAVYTDVKVVDPTVIDVYKSAKADFKYPLDIVFLIDNSGSMQNEINSVRDGLEDFSQDLSDRGYSVNYNVIKFGGTNTAVISNWFTNVSSVKTYFSGITAGGGYTYKQENGAEAIYKGIEQLRSNGRYLNRNLGIWNSTDGTAQKYMPSKKWIILLTDENMDKDQASLINGSYVGNNRTSDNYVVDQLSKKLVATNNGFQDNVTLTGIFHLNTLMTNLDNSGTSTNPTVNSSAVDLKGLQDAIELEGATVELFPLSATADPRGYINANDSSNPKGYIGTKASGKNQRGPYNALQVTDKLGHLGVFPSDSVDIFYTEFAKYAGSLFSMYEMGETGEYVSSALAESVKDIGIIQRWVIKYISPYGKEFYDSVEGKIKGGNDGEYREVMFSIDGVQNYKGTGELKLTSAIDPVKVKDGEVISSRNYIAPTTRLEAYFVNPDETARQLEKINGKINLKAKARSQYKKEIDGVLQWVNYPITKGTFIITGTKSNDGENGLGDAEPIIITSDDEGTETVSLLDVKENESTWYYAESNLDVKTFTTKFGKNPMNVVVKFIAETAEESKTVTLSGVKVVDKTAPKITDFKMTNVTLKDFMGSLKDSSSTAIFDSGQISGATVKNKSNIDGLTEADLSKTTTSAGIALNVKDRDNVTFEFAIEDESITASSTGVKINYNGAPYTATYVSAGINSNGNEVTNWKIDISTFAYDNGIDELTFDITDDSFTNIANCNTTQFIAEVFNQPELLSNTSLKDTTSSDSYKGDANTRYYNKNSLSANEKHVDALAYLIVFDYDKVAADTVTSTGTYPSSGTKEFVSSQKGDFSFYDGKHAYDGNVYVINSAGVIEGITHNIDKDALILNSEIGIDSIVNKVTSFDKNFYVDTIAPSVTDLKFKKDSDPNLSDSSLLNNNSVASGILLGEMSSDRPYKEGDGISLNFNLKEVNFFKTVLSQVSGGDIVNNPIVTIGGTTATVDAITGLEGTTAVIDNKAYKKSGIAVDLTSGDSAINSNMSLTVYDRAGNGTTQTFVSYYDDRIPNGISIASQVTDPDDNTIKFTNNVNFPLNSRSGTNYSVGLLSNLTGSLKHVGDITTSGAINLTSFETNSGVSYNPVLNAVNYPVLRSFSKSGKSGSVVKETVVLDTKINDARSSITETVYTYNSGSYVVDLTNTLKTIGELVGLKSYSISSSSNGAKLQHGITTDNISAVNTLVNLDTESLYRDTIGTTEYTSINNIILASSGNTKFKLILTDRLDNTKEIEYIVQIPNNVNIIGKKENSNKIINTKIDNSTKVIKIKSRTE